MNEQALSLDGNALAGLLEELFATELTDAPRSCGSRGAIRASGAHRKGRRRVQRYLPRALYRLGDPDRERSLPLSR